MQRQQHFLKRVAFLLILISGLGLAACNSGGNASSGSEEISVDVTLGDFYIAMSRTEFPIGATVTFNVVNEGAIEHEIVLENFENIDMPLELADGSVTEMENIVPGDVVSLTYTFTEAGAYRLACHMVGHYEAGMWLGFTIGDAELP